MKRNNDDKWGYLVAHAARGDEEEKRKQRIDVGRQAFHTLQAFSARYGAVGNSQGCHRVPPTAEGRACFIHAPAHNIWVPPLAMFYPWANN